MLDLLGTPPRRESGPSLDTISSAAADGVARVSDATTDDDLHLALYLLYGLHYRSFDGVDPAWEWNAATAVLQGILEEPFESALRRSVDPGVKADPEKIGAQLFEIEAADEGPALARFLEREGSLEQFRELLIHRSAYQLKESDPHSWAIPRLTGPAKTALLEVQYDEYGAGRPDRMHSLLFARMMDELGLESSEDFYLGRLPGPTLAAVNLMTFFGLHRRNRGAAVGHLAMFEMTSSQPSRAYGNALRRHGFGKDATDFFDEHVEADAVHENIAAYDLAGGLARQEPELAPDILFGASALLHVDNASAAMLIDCWKHDRSTFVTQPVPV
ncbi:MAG: iron-containing redox enzyme family protein [Solirubrobacterales bacterium]